MTKQTLHSSYWVDDTSLFDFDTQDINADTMNVSDGIGRIIRLATVRRAVANFVRILTNDSSIKVNFSSGKESYTDGKTVIISADDNPDRFDSMVGLALHEGSHCLLSDFEFLRKMAFSDTFLRSLHPKLRKMFHRWDVIKQLPEEDKYLKADENTRMERTLRQHLQILMNLIEDRRIDSYVYRMAPGYRPYYDAMYTKYFFNKDVEKNLRFNPDWRKPTTENYINWLLMMFSPHFDRNALPGLSKMVKMIDLQNIRRFDEPRMSVDHESWKTTKETWYTWYGTSHTMFKYDSLPLLWRVANELLVEILKRAQFHMSENSESENDIPMEMEMDDMEEMQGEGLPNYDLPQKQFNAERAKKAIEKMKKVMEQQGRKKKIKRNEEQQITSIESANAKMDENTDPIYGKVPCLVTKKMTKEIMKSEWFPFGNRWSFESGRTHNPDLNPTYRGFLSGVRMGQILAHRLQVRNEPQVTHFTRQEHGKIDRRILSQLGMDIENVFKRTTVDQYNPVLLYLSVDASGSMYGRKWENVMAVMTALAYASDKIRNLEVVVTLRGNLHNGTPTVVVAYDSRVDNFSKAKSLFPHLGSAGSTPEGLCYFSTLELIQECVKTHTTYFINFSDGEPGCSFTHNGRNISYGGTEAYQQTKRMVNQMREAGIRVMSYFITEQYSTPSHSTQAVFREMYGQDAEFVDVRNVLQVLRTLNKLLLVKG